MNSATMNPATSLKALTHCCMHSNHQLCRTPLNELKAFVASITIVALFFFDQLFSCILGQKAELGTLRAFRQKFTREDAIGFPRLLASSRASV